MNLKKCSICALFASLAFGASSTAFADCSDMGSSEWNNLSAQMAAAYDSGDMDTALNYCKQLTLICNQSPIINYTMSEIYRKMGNTQESHSYVRKASDFLQEYPVPQQLVEKIWFRRAEYELPYKAQAESLQAKLDETQNELTLQQAAFKQQYEDLYAESSASNTNATTRLTSTYEHDMGTVKWIGAGVAMGGAVIAAVGGALVGIYSKKADNNWKDMKDFAADRDIDARAKGETDSFKNFDKNNQNTSVGYGLLFGGLGLGVAGAAVAIVSHIKILNFREVNNEGVSFNVDANPGWVGVSGTF